MEYRLEMTKANTKGAVTAYLGDKRVGKTVYSFPSDDLIFIDRHSDVDNSQAGNSLGYKMIDHLVQHARAEGIKIIPICPFAKAMFEIHNDFKDVLK